MKVKRMGKHDLPIPSRNREGDLAYDLRANLNEVDHDGGLVIHAGYTAMIGCGYAFQFEPGQGGLVTVRSGHAFHEQLMFLGSGVIDSNYRGEVKVTVKNISNQPITIEHGERFAQIMFISPDFPLLELADKLNKTDRGDLGHGSSGKE